MRGVRIDRLWIALLLLISTLSSEPFGSMQQGSHDGTTCSPAANSVHTARVSARLVLTGPPVGDRLCEASGLLQGIAPFTSPSGQLWPVARIVAWSGSSFLVPANRGLPDSGPLTLDGSARPTV